MTPKEAFKIGFLYKCAEDGLTPEEVLQRVRTTRIMVKVAAIPGLDAAIQTGTTGVTTLFKALWPLLLFGPPMTGLAAGYGLSQITDNTYDKDEIRKRELIAAYERATSQLHQAQQRRLAHT